MLGLKLVHVSKKEPQATQIWWIKSRKIWLCRNKCYRQTSEAAIKFIRGTLYNFWSDLSEYFQEIFMRVFSGNILPTPYKLLGLV